MGWNPTNAADLFIGSRRLDCFSARVFPTATVIVAHILNLRAILANDANENDSISDELLDQTIQPRHVSLPAMQHDFLRVRHDT